MVPIPPSEREMPSTMVSIIQPMAAFWRSMSKAASARPSTMTSHTTRDAPMRKVRARSNLFVGSWETTSIIEVPKIEKGVQYPFGFGQERKRRSGPDQQKHRNLEDYDDAHHVLRDHPVGSKRPQQFVHEPAVAAGQSGPRRAGSSGGLGDLIGGMRFDCSHRRLLFVAGK